MFRDILIIGSFGLIAAIWFGAPEGRLRNAGLMISAAITGVLLISRSPKSSPSPEESPELESMPQTIEVKTDPRRSLSDCLRHYDMLQHPSATQLLKRIGDYRGIVIKIAKERSGQGRIWKNSDPDVRVRSCLCGELTREELVKSLEIREEAPMGPRVGSGMGMEDVLRKQPIAEDGMPSVRVLTDPTADQLFKNLCHHRPEARQYLLMARERYIENILRRLVGPLDGKGRSLVPLCVWKKRFDGPHFEKFEEIERKFMG